MPEISRTVDTNNEGGVLQRGAGTVYACDQPVALHVSPLTPHSPWGRKSHPPHRASRTTSGSPTVYAEGVPVVREGSSTSCGHVIIGSGVTVFVP